MNIHAQYKLPSLYQSKGIGPESLYCDTCIGKLSKPTITLTLMGQCPISNLSELFLYTAAYSNFHVLITRKMLN